MPDDHPVTPTNRPSHGYEPSEPRRVGHAVHRPDHADGGEVPARTSRTSPAVGEHRRTGSDGEGS
jgi:hypothetical protein